MAAKFSKDSMRKLTARELVPIRGTSTEKELLKPSRSEFRLFSLKIRLSN